MLTKETFQEQYKDAPILDAPLAEGVADDQPMPCYLVHGTDPSDAVAVVMNATDPSEALQVVVSKLGIDTSVRPLRASTYPTASRSAVRKWLGKPEPVKDEDSAPLDGEFTPAAEGATTSPVPISEPAPAGVPVGEKSGPTEPTESVPVSEVAPGVSTPSTDTTTAANSL